MAMFLLGIIVNNLICNVLNDHPSFKEIFLKIFKLFAAPRDLLFAKRFLTEEEINDVCRDCHEFCNIYTVLFKNKTIKPKMHFYSFDVPRFLKTFKTIGLLSEEEGESLHAAFNMENRQLASVRDPGKRIFLSLKRHSLRSQSDKLLMKANERLCTKCSQPGNRIFLKNGICEQCSKE